MENEKPLITVEQKITSDPSGTSTTTTTTTVQTNDDGKNNEINVEEATTTGTRQIETGASDRRYIDAIHYKGEIAILKTETELMNLIKVDSLEKIVKLMGKTMEDFYYDISFGIYTSEEIIEFRKSLNTRNSINDKYVKDYDFMLSPDDKLILPSMFGDQVFEKVEKEIENIKKKKSKRITWNKGSR